MDFHVITASGSHLVARTVDGQLVEIPAPAPASPAPAPPPGN